MPEMRLTILSAPPVPTHGWGRYTRDLVSGLSASGAHITLITSRDAPTDPGLPLTAYHCILPSVTHPARFNSLRLMACAPAVRRLAANSDLVHVFAEPYILSTIGINKPLFVTAHGTYVPFSAGRRGVGSLYRRAYQRATILCVSSYTERQVRAVLSRASTYRILNGVDVARYRSDLPSPEKYAPTVLCVGQVKARKGFHILAQAMKAVRAAVPNARAIFIGDTSDTAYVHSLKAQLVADGLTDVVQFLGRVSDETLLGWYHQADVFALPALNVGGKFEGFGLVYLEASAAGLPVIGTRDCGAEDAIRDGETGLLIPQNDPTALAEAVIDLLRDPERRARMGAAGRTFADDHTWTKVAARVIAAYQENLT